ncbi:MAG: type 4a pilus biogenesis protein PilO [Candidatus Omnitrophica bacterium]|nr:type 4a pilus biogenesis protein PilO [Candidatus Omnitrophota bacterium]
MRKKTDILITILLGLGVVASISVFVLVMNKHIALSNELKEKKKDYQSAKSSSRQAEQLELKAAQMQEKELELGKMIPINEQQPLSVIKSLTRLGGEVGLRDVSFSISSVSQQMSPASQNSGAPGAVSGGGGFPGGGGQMPGGFSPPKMAAVSPTEPVKSYLEMTFTSEYPQIKQFIKKIGTLPRIITVDGMKIERNENLLPQQTVTLYLVVYTFNQ